MYNKTCEYKNLYTSLNLSFPSKKNKIAPITTKMENWLHLITP